MQQFGSQFPTTGAEWHGHGQFPQSPSYAQPQSFGQIPPFGQAQPYGQAQPTGQPYPYGQPQPYAQSQPYAQPQQYAQGQQYAQQQQYAQPQAQPAPIAPVPCPTSPHSGPGGQGGQNAQPPPHPLSRQLVGIAKHLEQILPGYQIMISLLQDVADAPTTRSASGLAELIDRLKAATVAHFGALGAIRRMLAGESSAEALANLATGLSQLSAIHSQVRPQFERLIMSALPELRSVVTALGPTLNAADSALAQAAPAVQSIVGPRLWEMARNRTAEHPATDQMTVEAR